MTIVQSTLLSDAYTSQAELDVQLNVAKSNLQRHFKQRDARGCFETRELDTITRCGLESDQWPKRQSFSFGAVAVDGLCLPGGDSVVASFSEYRQSLVQVPVQ